MLTTKRRTAKAVRLDRSLHVIGLEDLYQEGEIAAGFGNRQGITRRLSAMRRHKTASGGISVAATERSRSAACTESATVTFIQVKDNKISTPVA